jgi:hypothetical protein
MVGSLGVPELLFFVILLGATIGIAVLCWVWMKNSRASQRRMEESYEQMIRLLEEQNVLLQRLADGGTTIH